MSEKSGNEIHEAYMLGLFDGESRIVDLIGNLIADCRAEIEKVKEAQE